MKYKLNELREYCNTEYQFNNISFKGQNMYKGIFTECTFSACNFTGVNIAQESRFINCTFEFCNLHDIRVDEDSFFQDCHFHNTVGTSREEDYFLNCKFVVDFFR